jgi:toxin HigB-1
MDLDHPLRLILEPIGDPLPLSKDGWLDLEKVTAVKIIKVEDYHGK